LNNEDLGSETTTDYLSITYTGFEQIIRMYGTESQEAADAIVRLDSDIERLLRNLMDQVGKDNLMVVFTGTHGSSWNVKWALAEGLPAGQFRARNAIALLNSYLSAIYGENYWIESYVNQQFYLDHSLIDQNQIPISEIQEKAARFLTQFTGIADAFTATQFNLINIYNTNGSVFLNTYHTKRSGDILINLEPGWIQDGNFVSDHLSIYEYDQKVPLVFWGGAIQAQISSVPVSLSNIAPTICGLINIPAPSGSNSKSLINYLVSKDEEER
jgi:arylsulfatase A-like enzyme